MEDMSTRECMCIVYQLDKDTGFSKHSYYQKFKTTRLLFARLLYLPFDETITSLSLGLPPFNEVIR